MRLTISLPPVHYERPRPSRGHGKFYSPHTPMLDQWRMLLRNQMRLQGEPIIEGPVTVTLLIGAESTTVQVLEAHGVIRPKGVHADLDNYIKFMLDALGDTAYSDDEQVVHVAAQFVPEDK